MAEDWMAPEKAVADGGPAFPWPDPSYDGNWNKDRGSHGMSLRDYFAAAAMQGMLAGNTRDTLLPESMASIAYAAADAMLEARRQR